MSWFESHIQWSLLWHLALLPIWLVAALLLPILTVGKLRCAAPWEIHTVNKTSKVWWRQERHIVVHPLLILFVGMLGYWSILLFLFS